MNLRESINKLNYSDLCRVRGWVKEAIIRKLDEEKVSVWMVCDEDLNYACYPIDQHGKAVEKMAELALKHAESEKDMPITLMVQERKIEESELQDFYALNESA